MSDLDREFEKSCDEYLAYLYTTANHKYGDTEDMDVLVQDTMTAFIVKLRRGESIQYPKAFLASTLHHKYNDMLRAKYKSRIVSCDYFEDTTEEETEDGERQAEEYAAVRREIGRLAKIYREVTVRYYVYGKSVDEIAVEMGIAKGTVLSRLSSARGQIKEGIETMEKYSEISYAPKSVSIEIWGNAGLSREPFSLLRSPIEANILISAYEKPVSIRELADTMGIPCSYIEPIVDTLVKGELLGRTSGGLVYTRCYMQKYEDQFGDIPAQEVLADKYAEKVWGIAWKHLEPLTKRDCFKHMTEKQKATMLLFTIRQLLLQCVIRSKPAYENSPARPPERKNGGKWLATATVCENGQKRDNIYASSGSVVANYCPKQDGKNLCQLFDCQSLFGDAHWAYENFKYSVSLHAVLRFYASLLPCDVIPDSNFIYELIPEFEKLHILRRKENGEIALDIPALPFEEVEIWNPVIIALTKSLCELLNDPLGNLWKARKNKVPKHIDCPEHFIHAGALGAYLDIQLLSIVKKGLMPYHVEIGKTPLIYIAYRSKESEKEG